MFFVSINCRIFKETVRSERQVFSKPSPCRLLHKRHGGGTPYQAASDCLEEDQEKHEAPNESELDERGGVGGDSLGEDMFTAEIRQRRSGSKLWRGGGICGRGQGSCSGAEDNGLSSEETVKDRKRSSTDTRGYFELPGKASDAGDCVVCRGSQRRKRYKGGGGVTGDGGGEKMWEREEEEEEVMVKEERKGDEGKQEQESRRAGGGPSEGGLMYIRSQ
eukprot:133908-Hanusia_phi.AAC.1